MTLKSRMVIVQRVDREIAPHRILFLGAEDIVIGRLRGCVVLEFLDIFYFIFYFFASSPSCGIGSSEASMGNRAKVATSMISRPKRTWTRRKRRRSRARCGTVCGSVPGGHRSRRQNPWVRVPASDRARSRPRASWRNRLLSDGTGP